MTPLPSTRAGPTPPREKQFGYNCDYIGFFPLPGQSDRALLVVNHEYTNPELMFPGYKDSAPSKAEVDVEIAAHGITVVELLKTRQRVGLPPRF
ncbi:MAG: DUF839 domain-containing protein [Dehalococcoidia bacterium]